MSLAPYQICLASASDLPLPALQPLAEAVFGAGERAATWFTRKLAREAVDPTLSILAFGPGDIPVAYLLICREPDDPTAYSSGLGVLPAHRGRGLARALLTRAAEVLPPAGMRRLQMTSEPTQRAFYERLGFLAGPTQHTLQCIAHGPGLDLRAHPPRPWPLPGRQVAGWREGTWSRTPSDDAATLSLAGHAWAHVSREGHALVVHRLCITDDTPSTIAAQTHAALDELRDRVARSTPLLLLGCDAVSCVTASWLQTGPWQVVQTGVAMQLALGDDAVHPPPERVHVQA